MAFKGVLYGNTWNKTHFNSQKGLPLQDYELKDYALGIDRNSWGVETCNSQMFALSDARDYSFSKVPYLEREEKITDQSNFVYNVT